MANTFREYLEQSSLFTFDTTSGQIIPNTSEVLSAVKELMSDAFDKRLDISDETPAGRLAEMYALAIKRAATVTAAFANQINPYYATGQMLDAIGSLFSTTRSGASATVIFVTVAGTPGTTIADGSIISDQAGNQFVIQGAQTIPDGGSTSCTAACTKTGPKDIATGSVTNIITTTVGWSSVTNTGISSAGSEIESDEHYRNRILLARWTGTAFVESIRAAIERCDNVDSVYVIENGEPSVRYLKDDFTFVSTQPASGKYIKMLAHSICPIVFGKTMTSTDYPNIAQAIYSTKSAGCAYTDLSSATQGSTKGTKITQNVSDDNGGISYPIVFSTPSLVQFGVNISVNKGSFLGTTQELIALVKGAIIKWANGEAPFVDGIKLGQSLYAFEIGAAVSDIIPSIQITNVQMVIGGSSVYQQNLFIYEIGSLNENAINVTVN